MSNPGTVVQSRLLSPSINMPILLSGFYAAYLGTSWETMFTRQDILFLVIISIILLAYRFTHVVIMQEEVRYSSPFKQ